MSFYCEWHLLELKKLVVAFDTETVYAMNAIEGDRTDYIVKGQVITRYDIFEWYPLRDVYPHECTRMQDRANQMG